MSRLTFNRTSMELKQWSPQYPNNEFDLLIEPVWNWNPVKLKSYTSLSKLLIEPVWNWNEVTATISVSSAALLIEPVWNWNPIPAAWFMILKLLLIEPVWNWNFNMSALPYIEIPAFNRTSMELKLSWTRAVWRRRFTFNRTSMELKPERSPLESGIVNF